MAETLLQAHPDANVVYAHNDEMAMGAIAALEAAGKVPGKDVLVLSIDGGKEAVQAVVDGKIDAVVECNPRFGPKAFETMAALRQGRGDRAVGDQRGQVLRSVQRRGRAAQRLLILPRRSRPETCSGRLRFLPAQDCRKSARVHDRPGGAVVLYP